MDSSVWSRVRWSFVAVSVAACGGGAIQYREINKPVGEAIAYGAPRNTRYTTTAESEHDQLRLIVREESDCDRLRIKIVQKTIETVRDGNVIQRDPPKNVQVVEGADGVVKCQERYARDVYVSLQVGGATYRLGKPNERGEVTADLSGRLRQDLYATTTPTEVAVLVEGKPAGTVPLDQFQAHDRRVEALIAEFRALVEKDQATLSAADIAKSYELYEQLIELAPEDARVRGLEARFIELVMGRKQREATDDLKRNLKALNEARAVVNGPGAPLLPLFMQNAINQGLVTAESLQWANARSIMALRRYSSLCQRPGGFAWSAITAETVPPEARIALLFLRFAYSDPYANELRALCGRLY